MKKPKYVTESGTKCRSRGSHEDAVKLVEFLMQAGGSTEKPAEQIAIDLGWVQRAGMTRTTDMGRFHIARNHVRDGRKDGKHCTGFDLHYRSSKQGSRLMLVDPSGSTLTLLRVAAEDMHGDLQQQMNMRTINGRRIATAESMANWSLDLGDRLGYQLMTQYTVEIQKFGAVSDPLIAQINAWIAGLPSAPAPAPVPAP